MCQEKQVLFIADEVQTGLGRTGKMLACEHEGFKPNILVLGKALSGGVLPVSAVLANNEIMRSIKPGEHGSTYGVNPLACAVATEALKILVDEKMAETAQNLGEKFRSRMEEVIQTRPDLVTKVRGKGLLNAILINDAEESSTAWDICVRLAENGL